jgi:uncharacterized RDD family membrane protein YckC
MAQAVRPAAAPTDVLADVRLAVETPEHVAIEYPLAGLGSRYCAVLIDLMVVGLALCACLVAGAGLMWAASHLPVQPDLSGSMLMSLVIITVFAVQWGYFFCPEGFDDGRTVGKRVMKLRAAMTGGHPLTLEAAAIRNLLRPLDLLGGGLVGGFAMLLTPRLQRLGDLAAGTVVVRELPSEFPAVGDASNTTGPPRLDADTFASLETWIDRCAELAPAARETLAARLATRVAEQVPRVLGTSDEAYLADVYADERGRRVSMKLGAGERRPAAFRLLRTKRERWETFGTLALGARRRGLTGLDEDAVAAFAARYRELTADLARARTYGASPQTLYALERLVGIGHNVLYRPGRRSLRAAWTWITRGFPTLVRRRWRPIGLAVAFMAGPGVLGYALVRHDPTFEDRLLSSDMLARAEAAPARQAAGKGYIDLPLVGGAVSSSDPRHPLR